MADRLDTGQRLLLKIAQALEADSGGISTEVQAALDAKEDKVNKSTNTSLGTSDTLYPSQKAVKTYADTKQTALGFTPENVANKDVDGTLAANSDTKYPSQKAAKTYIDAGDGSTLSQAQAYTDELTINHSTLTQASPTVIDFTGDPYKSITLTGAVSFESTNRSAARSITVRLIAGASSRNLTFHASWVFIGAAAPASLAANKEAILNITAFGTTEADVRVAYAAQP